jgi:hypothetical protein
MTQMKDGVECIYVMSISIFSIGGDSTIAVFIIPVPRTLLALSTAISQCCGSPCCHFDPDEEPLIGGRLTKLSTNGSGSALPDNCGQEKLATAKLLEQIRTTP